MLEPNLLIKIILYAFAYSPYIMVFLFNIFLFETFVWSRNRQIKAKQELTTKVYHNLAANQGEEIANQYLEFKNIKH